MLETTLETMHSDDALIVVAGKDGDLAFWVNDIRYLQDWPGGGCRIHLLKGKDSVTLFSSLSVQEVARIIRDETATTTTTVKQPSQPTVVSDFNTLWAVRP